jgi:hypothetical protein
MCDICRTAKRFPSVYHSLEFLANQIALTAVPPCVDGLIGELVGIEFKVDKVAEADWERANHGSSEA